jgi:hypothetical protein
VSAPRSPYVFLPLVLLASFAATALIALWRAAPESDPLFTVSPIDLDFGEASVRESTERFLVITNPSEADLAIERIEAPPPFRTGATSLRLEPGESRALGLAFHPSEPGHYEATLEIAAAGRTTTVSLIGEGLGLPAIHVEPASADFGEVEIGGNASSLITIENRGVGDLHLIDLRATGPFEIRSGNEVVEPGSRTTVAIHFAPPRARPWDGRFEITSNDPHVRQVLVPLQGVGVPQKLSPEIEVSPSTIDFSRVGVGAAKREWVEVKNAGRHELALSSITSAAPFRASARSRRIAPGSSLLLPVEFVPSEIGTQTDFMWIHSNDPQRGVVAIALLGEGAGERFPSRVHDDSMSGSESADTRRVAPGRSAIGPGEHPGDRRNTRHPTESARTKPPGRDDAPDAEIEDSESARAAEIAHVADVLEGSRVVLSSYTSAITAAHFDSLSIDDDSGTVRLDGVRLPRVNAALQEHFTFEPAEASGSINSMGDIDIVLPLEVVDRWGNPGEIDVRLTTGTATTVRDGRQIAMTGYPVRPDGTATLVGLETFDSGPLRRDTVRIVLNVRKN